MAQNIDKLIEMVENLENDFPNMNKENPRSVDMMKDRAQMLMPLIKISKEEPKNAHLENVYEDLEHRVAMIISKF
ncbi:hypothetical protein [Mesoflavibacter zeaxanthinifaciens]|uniref:hypothetical protein n=1 Tax=Mesoflavibacter zeaxanthinifaciens TaxID=393060 RepID=UPI003A95D815